MDMLSYAKPPDKGYVTFNPSGVAVMASISSPSGMWRQDNHIMSDDSGNAVLEIGVPVFGRQDVYPNPTEIEVELGKVYVILMMAASGDFFRKISTNESP